MLATNLLFVEHAYQAQDLLNKFGETGGKWIALGPSAMYYLAENKIPYTIPEDYCTRYEIEDVCVLEYNNVLKIAEIIDESLLSRDVFLKEWGIRPFLFYLWQFAQAIDGLALRTFELKKILSFHRDSDLFIHLAPEQKWDIFGIGFGQDETLWGRLLSLEGWKNKVHFFPQPSLPSKQGAEKDNTIARFIRTGIKRSVSINVFKNAFLRDLILSVHHGGWKNIAALIGGGKGNAVGIGLLHAGYEWREVMPEIIGLKKPLYFIRPQDLATDALHEKQVTTDTARSINIFWEMFRNSLSDFPVDFSKMLKDRFYFIIEKSPSFAKEIVAGLDRLFERRQIKVLLTTANPGFKSFIIKQYCAIKGIEVISWQHGAEWSVNTINQRYDLQNLTVRGSMFVGGNSVQEAYAASPFMRKTSCRVIATGLPSLEQLMKISSRTISHCFRILWPFGGYYGNGWYNGFSPPSSDRIYYNEQLVILEVMKKLLRQFQKISLTVKLYPSQYLHDNPPWVTELNGLGRVRIVHNKPNFVELLRESDVVIIDSPTTTLLQSMATTLPVFVSMGLLRWPGNAVELIKKRAYCADNATELMDMLEGFIRSGDYRCDVKNVEFLREYGIHEGNSKITALSLINRYLDGQQEN